MAAAKHEVVEPVVRYRVVGAVAVIHQPNKHRKYLNRNAVFTAADITPEHAEHLLRVGLIEVVEAAPESEPAE